MANVLDSEKQQQILALGRLGWTLRRIEQETGVRRETASQYLKQAGIEVRPPGRWGHPAAKPAIEVFTDSDPPPVPGRSPTASACEPHREWIERAVRHGRDAMAIWQDLVDDWEFAHSYQSVRFLTFRSSSKIWAELHERAFRRLGGAPRVTVLDNLKEGVLTPDIYEPTLNPLYRDVLAHYGVTALPCRVRDPNRKGKVESGVNHAQRKLRGLRFESLEEAQSYLDRWETNWADTRIHGTTKRQVRLMFEEEKPHLLPLPIEPFRYYQYGDRTVHLDGAVEVDGAYYHVPPGRIGQRLRVQWDVLHVRILCPKTGELLREHVRQKKGYHRMRDEDRPQKTPESTVRLLSRACNAGESIGGVCQAIHHAGGETGVRRILGILSLVKKHGAPAVEPACAMALEMQLPTYQFVRRYLERQPTLPLSLKQVDPLIRELTHYRDLIDRRLEGEVHEPD